MDNDDDRRVAEWYDALSHSYDELYGSEQHPKQKIVLDFLGGRRFEILIDVGCGSGAMLQNSHHIYDFAIGVDLSVNMLRAAKKRGSSKNDFVAATSRMLPVRDGIADCLVSISTLKADPSYPQIISELRRVCRKNGTLVISLFHQNKEEFFLRPSLSIRSARFSDRESVYLIDLGTGRTGSGNLDPLG